MPTIKAEVTAPTFRTEITRPHLTIELPERHMRVEITDAGYVRVVQEGYDLLDGAPSDPDTPRYTPPGEYSFELPEMVAVNEMCDTPPGSPGFDHGGTFAITAAHRHG